MTSASKNDNANDSTIPPIVLLLSGVILAYALAVLILAALIIVLGLLIGFSVLVSATWLIKPSESHDEKAGELVSDCHERNGRQWC